MDLLSWPQHLDRRNRRQCANTLVARWVQRLVSAGLVLVWQAGAAGAVDSQMFDARGVEIHYLVAGSGEPVVLIHGLYSSARINWQLPGIIAALAEHHQVIALDLPGYGLSDRPAAPDAYGLQWIEDIALLLDRLNIQTAHFVGYSMGGIVALRFIADHPKRVLSGTLGAWDGCRKEADYKSSGNICTTPLPEV
jgi:predicted alpha/beta-fold hydrolase